MKIGVILGTRPEIIKLSPIIRECKKQKINYFIIHTGQHYSEKLDKIFFEELELPLPKYNLEIGSKPYNLQISAMTTQIEEILKNEGPEAIIVQGDTNSVLAGALAAKKQKIKVAHVEAGLRSGDLSMLEEINRIIVDNISTFLFVPTNKALTNLKKEKNNAEVIMVTGNTIVDAVKEMTELAERKSQILTELQIKPKEYILATTHRAENTDSKKRLKGILEGLQKTQEYLQKPLILPLHPRTKKQIEKFQLEKPKNITIIEPQGFLDFIKLEINAKIILTDSGGIQEESAILGIPCVTLRDNTERQETVDLGLNAIAGTTPDSILSNTKTMLTKTNIQNKNPYGEGDASKQTISAILNYTFSRKQT